MNRRKFLLTAAVAPTAAAIMGASKPQSKRWGLITVERCFDLRERGINIRVYFNGEDVSNRCREAHDIEGWVLLYKHKDGKPYLDPVVRDSVVMERLHGEVRIKRQ